MIKTKFWNAFAILLILLQAVGPLPALAMAGTNQSDYAPGSVVTLSGDNSDGAGFAAGEAVHVDVSGPNGFVSSCDATADDNGAWSCQVSLPADVADGSYSYTATGGTSGVSQSGGFTVTTPATPTVEPTQAPTEAPTVEPTQAPTQEPTLEPTTQPTEAPTLEPTQAPTQEPTTAPTSAPTVAPTVVVTPAGPLFIQSDKDDYSAGELVTLTSGNWQPSESVHLIVNDTIGNTWVLSTDVLADANGAFVYQFNLPDWFVAQYHVYAYGAASGATTWDFTDARSERIFFTGTGGGSVTVSVDSGNVSYATSGAGNCSSVGSGTGTSTVTLTGTCTTLSTSTNGANVTITATANGTSYFAGWNGGTNGFSTCSSNAVCGPNVLPGGQNDVTVTFTTKTNTTTTASNATATYGDASVTLNATVTSGVGTVNEGTVTFTVKDGAITIGSPVTSGTVSSGAASASFTIPTGTTAKSYTIQAVYNPASSNPKFNTSSDTSKTLTVNKATSTTVVAFESGPYVYRGSAFTATATVTGAGGLNQSVAVVYSGDCTNVTSANGCTATATFAGDTNHTGSTDSKSITITKATSTTTVAFESGPYVYRGTAFTATAAVTGAGGLSTTATVVYSGDCTNVTTTNGCTATAIYAGDANHTGSTDSKSITITKATSTTVVTFEAGPYVYRGTAFTATVVVTGAGGLNQSVAVVYSGDCTNVTSANGCTATAIFAGDTNHSGSTDSKSITITKATSTTTVSCTAGPFTYTGAAITPCSVTVTGAGGLSFTPAPTYANNVNAGTASASYTYVGDANHTGSSDSKNFTIGQASSTTVVSCPTSVTYDGSAQTPCTVSVTGVGGLNLTPTPSYSNNTNVGTATASYTFAGDANHTGSSDSKDFAIDQATSITVVSCPSDVTYDGSAQTPCTATVTGAGGLNQSVSVSYSNNTDAGTATANASFAGDANHTGSSDSENFTINQASSTTMVSCPANVTYTGAALEPCTASVTGAGGLNQSLPVTYSNNTNAGTATADASYVGDANHTGSSDSKTFTIDKASSTTTVTCPTNVTYDGSAQTPCTASYSGAGGLSGSLTVNYTNNTNAGTATASASYGGDANHESSTDSKTFAIDKAASITTVSCLANVTYDGSAQEPCSASVTGAGGLNQVLSVSYTDNVNAGTATASASYAGDANHESSSDSKTFAIDKAASVTTVTCPASVTYNGSTQTPCSASVSGAGGLSQTLTVNYSNNTNAGTASASASYPSDANHNPSSDSKNFTINKADAVCTVTPYDITYDGDSHTATGSCLGVLGETLAGLDLSGTTHTNAGSYAGDSWTFTDVTGNYNDTSGTVDDNISKADATCTIDGYSVTYDGFAHTATGQCAGVDGPSDILSGLDLSATTHVNAGDYPSDAWTFNGGTNYNDQSGTVHDSVAKANAIINVTPYTVTYDGNAHTATGTATGVESTPVDLSSLLDLSGTTHTNAGDYLADAWSFAGNNNYNPASGTTHDSIAKANASIVVTPYSVTYDGNPHTATGTASGVETTPVDLSSLLDLSDTTHTNAGDYPTDAWSFAGNSNYNPANGIVHDSIAKAVAVIVVTPYNVTYNGSAHTATGTATGVNNEDLSSDLNLGGTTHTSAGNYLADPWTFTDSTGNYNDASGTVDDFIGKANATIVVTAYNVTYDGSSHTATGSVTGVNAEALAGLDLSGTSHTSAGTYTNDPWTFTDVTGNYNNASGTVDDNIDKADADIVVTPYSITYDGTVHTATGTATGVNGEDLSALLNLNGTTHTDAGTYNGDAWSFAGDDNYNSATGTVDDNIDKASSTTTVTCPANVTYTGAALEPCSATVNGAGSLNQSLTVSYSNNVNAGTASASASFAGDANHNPSSDSKTFTIDKADSVTVVTCPASVTYDGTAQTPCTAAVTGVGSLNQVLTVSYGNNTDAGIASASASYAGDANHNSSSDSKTFTINKASSTTTVTVSDATYDGNPHGGTANVTGAGGLNQAVTVNYAGRNDTIYGPTTTAPTNSGDYQARATFAGDANHNGSQDSKPFTISKASSTTVVTCAAGPFTYDGSAQTPCSAMVTGDGGLNQSLTVNYSNNTNAGMATANASYAGDANHTGSSDSKNFTIDKAASVTTVTCPANVTYTGSALTPCSAAVTGAGGLNQPVSVSYTNNTNAGTATASASYAGDTNHTGSSDSKNFTIDKAVSVTTVTCPANVTYTGSALTPCSAAVTGAGGLSQSLTVNYSNNTNAGTASASASFAGDANHTGSSDSKNFTIDKAASVTTVTCTGGPFVYNGVAQTPCSANVTGTGGLNQVLTVNYINNVNAGTATASASYAGDANHNNSSDSKNFTIAKATSTTTVTCPSSVYFTGSPQTPCSATVTGAGGLNLSLTVTYTNNTNVGTALASASYTGDANHNGSSDSKTFTIAAWTLKGFYSPVDMSVNYPTTLIWNTVKGGSTVPLKFEIFAGTIELTDTLQVKSITDAQVACSAGTEDSIEETITATGGTLLRYDSTGGQFIFNWKTPTGAGKCYRVTLTTQDGSTLMAFFKLK